ncbi:anoctamin-10-like isoform X2 [Mytilus edulis]
MHSHVHLKYVNKQGESCVNMATERIQSVSLGKTSSSDFQPLVIIQFSTSSKQAAIEWLVAKLQATRASGGAELEVSTVVMHHNQETLLYVGGTTERLLLGADMMDMEKKYGDGNYREFSIHDAHNFLGSEDLDSFLTMAEKQKIILHEIEAVRATEEDPHIPGYENIKLYPGKSIIKKYQSRNILTTVFPIHDDEYLKKLGAEWYQMKHAFKQQPIDRIQYYFGDKIALYFAFLGFYTIALLPPAMIGIIYFVTSWESMYREAIFSVFNLIWATLFLEAWKRYNAELSFRWGTTDIVSSKFEEPRANFYGKIGRNVVTGKPEPVYPKWKRVARFYGVTVPVVAFWLVVAFYVMLGYFYLQALADKKYENDKSWFNMGVLYLPTAIYAIIIGVVNTIYRSVAKKLNDWENHRLQSSYDNHFIIKLILFDFVNCFISLFYVAFYLQDMTLLRSHLAALLITQQVIGQIKEAMVPFIFMRRRKRQVDELLKKTSTVEKVEYYNNEVDDGLQKQVNLETTMDEYEGTLDDYLEMFLQFGYVFLFSSAFPLAAVWALLNNVTEIRSDAFKMCKVFRRPFAETASNIGAWQLAFELISVMAVITNCALIGMNPEVKKLLPTDITPVNTVLIFVLVEHIILAVKFAVAYFIPDTPKWVQVELARVAFKSKQALHKETSGHGKMRDWMPQQPKD